MSTPVTIIAEAGVNHNGSLEKALELVDVAAKAGADFVKFQTFNAANLVSVKAPKAAYQMRTTDLLESQYEMLRKLQLSEEAHQKIIRYCKEKRICFLSTPFDLDSLHLLTDTFNLDVIKFGSGELTNAPILLAAARKGCRIILSTGMGTLAETETALGVLAFGLMFDTNEQPTMAAFSAALTNPDAWKLLKDRVTLMHCTTEYPAAVEDTNLKAIDTLKVAFGLRTGFSDHTEGNVISLAAVARGASVIEKHFTLDRNLPGPDHTASIEPDELACLIRDIRKIERAVGNGIKQPSLVEKQNRDIIRKSIVATRKLESNQILTADDIAVKRPGTGCSPIYYWDMIGKRIDQDYDPEEPLKA